MSDPYIGLSSASQTILDQYQQWSRLSYEEAKRAASVDAANQQVGNVLQENYTRDELRRALTGQSSLLLHSLDSRMAPFIETTAALLRAVLREADRQRVALAVDAGAVLGAGAEDVRRLLSGPRGRLAPLTVADAAGEAGRQLAEANDAVRRLQDEVQRLSEPQSAGTAAASAPGDIERDGGRGEEVDMRSAVEALRAEVQEARRELSVRLNESSQYQQVKRILTKKNELIKAMRAQLARYCPSLLHTGGEDEMEKEEF